MADISRRTLLNRALLASALGGGALLGLTRPIRHKIATPPPPPPMALTAALARQQRLLAGYDQALASQRAHPGLAGLRADVAAHGNALREVLQHYPGWRLSVTSSTSQAGARPAGTATAGSTATPVGSAAPAGSAGRGEHGRGGCHQCRLPGVAGHRGARRRGGAAAGQHRRVPDQPRRGSQVTAPGQDAVAQALQRVLAAQHAAVYSYPVIGVALRDSGQVRLARQLEDRHRQTRDELMAQLAARRVVPVPAEADYTPPQPVTGPADAQRWALELEQACAAAYRYLLVAPVLVARASDGKSADTGGSGAATLGAGEQAALRRQALAGLNTAALNATGWRSLLSPTTPTVAFPGL
jgi:hypothetical protein